MGRRGTGYENAHVASFFSTPWLEHTCRHDFADHDRARRQDFGWFEACYNLRRRPSSIDCLSPVDFENLTAVNARHAPRLRFERNST